MLERYAIQAKAYQRRGDRHERRQGRGMCMVEAQGV